MSISADTLSRWLDDVSSLRRQVQEMTAASGNSICVPSGVTLARVLQVERELCDAYLDAVRREAGAA